MTSSPAGRDDPTLVGALDQMERLIAAVAPDQMSLPTPCSDWDVRDLLQHVVDGTGRFASMAAGQRVDWTAARPDPLGDDPATAWRQGRVRLLLAIREHPEPASRVLPMLVIECAVHAWDLATATGRAGLLDPALAEGALGLAQQNLTAQARAGNTAFGPEVPVSPDALPYDRLAGFLGRHL